jgi:hypothetical protein
VNLFRRYFYDGPLAALGDGQSEGRRKGEVYGVIIRFEPETVMKTSRPFRASISPATEGKLIFHFLILNAAKLSYR